MINKIMRRLEAFLYQLRPYVFNEKYECPSCNKRFFKGYFTSTPARYQKKCICNDCIDKAFSNFILEIKERR